MIEYDDQKYYTELDNVLQSLSLYDWKTFCQLIGEENIERAKTCIRRARGKSWNQIAIRKNKTVSAVRWECRKCPDVNI